MFTVFEIRDLNREIRKYLDRKDQENFILVCKKLLACNLDLFTRKYRKGKYADLTHYGVWEWIPDPNLYAHPLPFFLIKPDPAPTNTTCSAQTLKRQPCKLKPLVGKYCCKIHSNQEDQFVLTNRPLPFFPCKCSACMSAVLGSSELNKRRFRKNIKNNHCVMCQCKDCVCPARIKSKHYSVSVTECYWDGDCYGQCYTCKLEDY